MKEFTNYYACDFETVNYVGCTETEVWSAAYAELYSDNEPTVLTNLDDFMNVFLSQIRQNCTLYFHNLKFDGSFILDWLLRNDFKYNHVKTKEMHNRQFDVLLSNRGKWYNMKIKYKNHIIELRDSVKLLPLPLRDLGKAFKTKHQKLDMDYTLHRHADEYITAQEMEYIKNDIYVLKECLEFTFSEGHTKLTIGSCCISEFKSSYTKKEWEYIFPDLYACELGDEYFPENWRGFKTMGEYCRQGYKGAFTYLNQRYAGKVVSNGATYDANSLYPSVMHSMSGNRYPVGKPTFFNGGDEFDKIKDNEKYLYFVRVRCRFNLKDGFLPTIQIKGNPIYNGREYLSTSDPKGKDGNYSKYYVDENGVPKVAYVDLTLTKPDYILLKEHYELIYFKVLDGCYFVTDIGIFDSYINKYMKIKETTTGAKRYLAKLYLNNLYGRFAQYIDSSYQIPKMVDEVVAFDEVEEYEKDAGYIPIGAYVTAYARYDTITKAQQNYKNFIYSDTDSIHMFDEPPIGIPVHETKLCHWKKESTWEKGKFIRPKTYIERERSTDGIPWHSHLTIRCAGMPDYCKNIFEKTMSFKDFDYGLKIWGKLMPKRVKGGIILVECEYTMRKQRNIFADTVDETEYWDYINDGDGERFTTRKNF